MPRPVETPRAPTPTPVGGVPVVPAGARAYDIDPTQTRITVLVYRAGPFARLGHNHAITSDREQGYAWIGKSPESSGFELRLPVAAFVVDDPAARAAAGPDFPGVVPDDARAGTTQNMLRPEVLDAIRYPEIVVRCSRATASGDTWLAHIAIRVRDTTREFDVPVAMQVDADRLTAKGALTLRQTDFGITPFSVAGGAIQVADAFDVRFEVVAVARADR